MRILNNIKCQVSRHKKQEYVRGKVNKLATNSRKKNIINMYRGINEFKKGYKPGSNLVKDQNGDLLADLHSILNRWKNYFSQLLNVHNVNDVRKMEVHTDVLLVPDTSPFEVKIAIAKLKR
jgi:hypothetical protein